MTNGRSTFLVDTNVLVYGYDPRDPVKQQLTIELTQELVSARRGWVSTQVLGEFFNTLTRKLPVPLTPAAAEREVRRIISAWNVVDLTAAIVLDAVTGVQRYQLSYWDALIWAAARSQHIRYVLSEDFNDGADLGGVRFLNPFAPHFDLAQVL